jgi:hypothetical protein
MLAVLGLCCAIPAVSGAAVVPDSLRGLDMAKVETISDTAASQIRGEAYVAFPNIIDGIKGGAWYDDENYNKAGFWLNAFGIKIKGKIQLKLPCNNGGKPSPNPS